MNDPKMPPNDVLIVFADLQAGIIDLDLTIDTDDLRRGVRGRSDALIQEHTSRRVVR